jgi:hypothetical protein
MQGNHPSGKLNSPRGRINSISILDSILTGSTGLMLGAMWWALHPISYNRFSWRVSLRMA